VDATMQFTELSELNKVVGLMRISSCNSPTFHDRQDSEVDRIYNSSPKMEMQLRNSWIDKMASFKPMPTTASSSSNAKKTTTATAPTTTTNGAKAAAAAAANGSSAKKADAESDAKAGNKAENGKDGKDTKANGNGAADAKRRMSTAPAKKGMRVSPSLLFESQHRAVRK
jgi:hypothetical protein